MHASRDLTIEIALLTPPDNVLQALRGVRVRNVQMNHAHPELNAVQPDSWVGHSAYAARSQCQLSIEGIVRNSTANQYLRRAALAGERCQLRVRWPDFAHTHGEYIISEYEEFADIDDALSYRALLISSATQVTQFD